MKEYLDTFSKFRGKDFRPHQQSAIEHIIESEKSVVVIQAPTGSGKSLIGAVAAAYYYDSTYLTGTKVLQDQIVDDFPEFALLKGRGNYPCVAFESEGRMCDACPYLDPKSDCEMFGECVYIKQRDWVASQPMRILNYSYFLHESYFTGKNSKFSSPMLLVCDEADTLEHQLLSFIQLQITGEQLDRFKLDKPKDNWVTEDYKSWMVETYYYLVTLLRSTPSMNERRLKALMSMTGKFGLAVEVYDGSWITDYKVDDAGYESWVFKPIWMSKALTDRFFRSHAGQKTVLMSATFPALDIYAKCIGIPEEDMDFFEIPTTFDVKRRPIYFDPIADMGYKSLEAEFPQMVAGIKAILKKHSTEKGLIHTNSYKLANMIYGIDKRRMISHNSKNREETLDFFKTSNDPLVLVSPSMERGVSLNGDETRFIIVAKTPFANLKDPQISKRLKTFSVGRRWYEAVTAQTMEQQAGRGMRSKDDRCVVYFLDTHSQRLYLKHPNMFSGYFRDCVITVEG